MARHALVVGLSQYPYIGSLEQPPIDAEKIAQILEQHGEYTVTRLPQCWNENTQNYEIDPQQTVSDRDLALALKKLLIELPENGATIEGLVYFAGHGFTFNSNMGVEKGAIATSNTKITTKDGQVIDYENAVSFSDLNDVIQKSNLQSLVLILDCCHSGYFIEKEMTKKSLYSAFIDDHRNYYCISACQTREKSTVLMGHEHSIFSTAVINGLDASQANQQGKITGDRLYDYIQSELTVKGPKFGQTAIKMGWGEAINIVSYPQVKSINAVTATFNADNPYLGLYAFQAKDEPYFHGRKRAIQSLISRLDRNRFLAVIGSSGCGKSSLIKAGLLPELQRDRVVGSKDWQIEIMTPGDRPLDILLEKLEHLQKYQNTLLFIDQCEEIFTLCKDVQERQRFFQLIAQEASVPQRLARVLVGIRGDFLDQCAEFPAVAKLINRVQPTTYCVEGLALEELQLAIEEPARLHGVNLEAGLAGAIAHDVINQPGALPLLQYALKELWEVCVQEKGENLLTWSGYQKIDGVAGALSRRANNIYNSLTESEQKLVQQLFLELAEIGDGNTVTKRSVQKESLVNEHPQLPKIIDDLTKHRLIAVTERKDSAGEYQVYIDLAHESLFEKWDLLKSWIESDRHNLRLKRKFQNDCQDWLNKYQRSADALLTGAWLGTLAEWITTYQPQLSPIQQEFFDLSLQHRDQERQEKEEKQRQLLEIAEEKARAIEAQLQAESEKVKAEKLKVKTQKLLTLGSIVFGIFLASVGIYALQSSYINNAKLWLERAKIYNQNNQQLEAMMASVKSLNYLKWVVFKENYLIELKKIITNIQLQNVVTLDSEIMSLNVSSLNEMIVTGTNNGKLQLWNMKGEAISDPIELFKQELTNMTIPRNRISVKSILFNQEGNLLASALSNGTIDLRELSNNQLVPMTVLKNDNDKIPLLDLSFTKDGNFLASCNESGFIQIWQRKGKTYYKGATYRPNNSNPEYYIRSLDFSPFDNSIIVYGDSLGQVILKNINSTKQDIVLGKYENSVLRVRFSKNGKYLVATGIDGIIEIWQHQQSSNNPKIIFKSIGKINTGKAIYAASFSEDEVFLGTAGISKKIDIWNIEKIQNNDQHIPTKSLEGHTEMVTDLTFTSTFLLSVSFDQTLRFWKFIPNSQNIMKDYLKYSCNYLKSYITLKKQQKLSQIPVWFNYNQECK
jgi:WD40 repeat protein/ABC-type Fe3+/spermidine/putrescine transport system ATPase subunit